jgi:DNA modification methylase
MGRPAREMDSRPRPDQCLARAAGKRRREDSRGASRQILASSDVGDVIWEPFGGLASASVAALRLGRRAHAAEIDADYFAAAAARLRSELARAPIGAAS